LLQTKVDRLDFETNLNVLKATIEEDMQSLLDCLGTKASLDDLNYFKSELTAKLEKTELEAFRQDFVDRIANFDSKLGERNTLLQ
jgi:hypothetical protein